LAASPILSPGSRASVTTAPATSILTKSGGRQQGRPRRCVRAGRRWRLHGWLLRCERVVCSSDQSAPGRPL